MKLVELISESERKIYINPEHVSCVGNEGLNTIIILSNGDKFTILNPPKYVVQKLQGADQVRITGESVDKIQKTLEDKLVDWLARKLKK
jgi:uncharacterized protein YlzI (FlbEa/FlbD family)